MNNGTLGLIVLGIALAFGFLVGFGTASYTDFYHISSIQHNAEKMLQLRMECLRQDTSSKYTTWCDEYAERFSRVSNK